MSPVCASLLCLISCAPCAAIERLVAQRLSSSVLAACLLAEGKTTLKGVPRLSDIDSMIRLLGELGCHVYRHESDTGGIGGGPALNGPLDITVTDEKISEARYDIVKTMRASICTMGPLLAKRKKAIVAIPGGCQIGDRPVDCRPDLPPRHCKHRGHNLTGDCRCRSMTS